MSVIRVELFGGFRIIADGHEATIPASTRRLVAFLAMRRRPAERVYAAGCLYADKTEERAQANLRSAIWRLRQCAHQLVEADPTRIWLRSGVEVDVDDAISCALRLIDERIAIDDPSLDKALFCADLLPEWYDDFVELERERLRQLQLHALEAVARRLHRLGRHAEALDAALTAVAHEPMRESAHRLTITIHLAEGNSAEAMRQYGLLERILDSELGIAPSGETRQLLSSLRRAPAAV